MFGWERDASLAESSPVIVLQWALASEGVLHCIDWSQAVDRRFPSEDARFNFVIVVREMPPHIHSATNADHRCQPVVRYILAVLDPIRRIRQMPTVARVRNKHRRGRPAQRHEP